MPTCFKCGEIKDRSDFYAHPAMADGILGKCKDCTKKDTRANYAAKREQYSRYDQERNKTPKRRAAWVEYGRRKRKKNPEKHKARMAVARAVASGKLIRQPCIYCGSDKTEAHHTDYSKPLEVVWACFKCHFEKEHGCVVTAVDFHHGAKGIRDRNIARKRRNELKKAGAK